jgi:hypothetical protein
MNVRLAMGITLLAVGCEAGDLSNALDSGRCDNHDRCGAGFECSTQTRECVPLGTLDNTQVQGGSAGDAGAGGTAGPAGAAGAPTAAGSGGSPSQDGGPAGAGSPAGAGTAGQGCSGATLCDGACVDTSSDPDHCGACGRACSSHGASEAPRCVGGRCIVRCSPGLADCVSPVSPPDDGCETDITTDDNHCGSCNNLCRTSASKLACTEGRCGCTDDSSCGASDSGAACGEDGICTCAGTTCRPGEVCLARGKNPASCLCDGRQSCGPNETCCVSSGKCVDLETNTQHCGACGRSCPTGQFECASGECRCVDDGACDAGSAGLCADGLCRCTGVLCQAGERCLADGGCG